MELVWTHAARRDLERIWTFNAHFNIRRAEQVEDRLIERAIGLLRSPYSGRPGTVDGTRELSIPDIQ